MKQLSLFKKTSTDFGGEKFTGKRKTARPIDSRKSLFLTLKATSDQYLLDQKNEVTQILERQSQIVEARLYSFAVHADHLHIAIQFKNQILYRRWIRATTGILSRKVPGVEWVHRPHSQVVTWGRQFKRVMEYIGFNRREAELIEWSHHYVAEFQETVVSGLTLEKV